MKFHFVERAEAGLIRIFVNIPCLRKESIADLSVHRHSTLCIMRVGLSVCVCVFLSKWFCLLDIEIAVNEII